MHGFWLLKAADIVWWHNCHNLEEIQGKEYQPYSWPLNDDIMLSGFLGNHTAHIRV